MTERDRNKWIRRRTFWRPLIAYYAKFAPFSQRYHVFFCLTGKVKQLKMIIRTIVFWIYMWRMCHCLEMIIDPLFHFLPYGDKVEQSNQWPTQFLQFISIPINTGFPVVVAPIKSRAYLITIPPY